MRISKSQRWLDLIAFLVRHRFPVDVDQVMNGVPAYREKWNSGSAKDKATVQKMFERDKSELRDAGIPLETREYTIDHGAELAIGYELSGRDFYLPYLRIVRGESSGVPGLSQPMDLDTDDFQTAVDGLRRVRDLPGSPLAQEARTALSKLTFDADPAAIRDDPVVYADSPEAGEVRELTRVLRDALSARRRVRFTYHGIHRDTATDRDVAPYGLLFQRAHWYLIGSDATREGDLRVFRVSRIETGTLKPGDPDSYRIPDTFDASEYAAREAWELGEDDPVVTDVRFAFPLSLWADRNGQGTAVEEAHGGAVVRRFDVRQTDPFLRWLQSFAGDAVVVAPPELREAQKELARRTLEVYGA